MADGEAGELWVRGPQVSGVYEGIGSVLDADGWFPTRDRARVDSGGYLFIEGRVDDTIIRGGENIAPAEIEDVLIRHPALRDAAVVGVPDEEWGERIVAAVVPLEGATADADEIRAFVRARLRGSRTPDLVVVRADLPYGPTGKIVRRELIQQTMCAFGKQGELTPMKLSVGSRVRSQVCSSQSVVVRCGTGDYALTCGGHELVPMDAPVDSDLVLRQKTETGNLVGKRYVNAAGDLEVLITAAGEGALAVAGEPLGLKETKPLPSSD